jgi:protein-arginine kinase activator protein McsA
LCWTKLTQVQTLRTHVCELCCRHRPLFDNSHAFLQSKIIKHQLWQDSSLWDSAFAFKVQNDMDQINKLCPDNNSELQDKLRSVLFAQFSTFMIIMKCFDIEASVICEFVQRQSKKYHLTSIEQEPTFRTAELT